jgi:TonB family protein
MVGAMKRAAPRVLAWLCLGFALHAGVRAQDVTVAPIAPVFSDDPPDQMPVFRRPLRPEFPTELRKTADVGWALVDAFVDARGTVLSCQTYATQPLLKAAVEQATGERGKIDPARRAGTPVNARVRLAILFNPASANTKLSDATPRLLDAAVVVDPRRTSSENDPLPEPAVVWVTAVIDAQGRLTELRDVPSEAQKLFERELQAWRFGPARRGGVPVAADLRVPVIVTAPPRLGSKDFVPARPTRRVDPTYPFAMRLSGLRGEVVVEFVVDVEGRVRNASVVSSLNPAFEQPALDAITQWKFDPARYRDVPVNSRARMSIHFALRGTADGGSDGIETRRRGDPSKLPAELQYDVEPKPTALVTPKFPYGLLKERVYGKAQVNMLIGPKGKVLRTKVLKADRPEFGLALQAACEGFEYQPALKNAQPTYALLGFEQEFSRRDARLVSDAEADALALEQKHPDRIVNARRLDRPPKPRVTRPPLYPTALALAQKKGSAVIEFLIAEDGKVLLPRIISATEPEFGYAAAQAVAAWQFAPPTAAGKPTITRVQVPFGFDPPSPPPADAAEPATAAAVHP